MTSSLKAWIRADYVVSPGPGELYVVPNLVSGGGNFVQSTGLQNDGVTAITAISQVRNSAIGRGMPAIRFGGFGNGDNSQRIVSNAPVCVSADASKGFTLYWVGWFGSGFVQSFAAENSIATGWDGFRLDIRNGCVRIANGSYPIASLQHPDETISSLNFQPLIIRLTKNAGGQNLPDGGANLRILRAGDKGVWTSVDASWPGSDVSSNGNPLMFGYTNLWESLADYSDQGLFEALYFDVPQTVAATAELDDYLIDRYGF